MDTPQTNDVRVGEGDVAYQVFGDGPIDLLFSYGLGVHVELIWEVPIWTRRGHSTSIFAWDCIQANAK